MILCALKHSARYGRISSGLATALEWLSEHFNDNFVTGVTDIDRQAGIYAKFEEPAMVTRDKAALEAHRRYIDIHVPLQGAETIGWADCNKLRYGRGYDTEKDIEFFGDAAMTELNVTPGQIAIFFPDDAHAPNIGTGRHRKICIKIPVDSPDRRVHSPN